MLVNNAGVGIGAPATEHQTKYIDLQLDVNMRAIILFYRECAELLRAAGAEHRNALVVNMASIAGKSPQPLAVGVLGDEGRRRRVLGGDEQGASSRTA